MGNPRQLLGFSQLPANTILPSFICHSAFRMTQGGTVLKNPPANAADVGSSPGLGRFPGGGNGNPLQYSFFFN